MLSPHFPSIRMTIPRPFTADGVAELLRLRWWNPTPCPICGTPAARRRTTPETCTHYVCPQCQRFTLTDDAAALVMGLIRYGDRASVERLSAHAGRSSHAVLYNDERVIEIGQPAQI